MLFTRFPKCEDMLNSSEVSDGLCGLSIDYANSFLVEFHTSGKFTFHFTVKLCILAARIIPLLRSLFLMISF